MYLVVNMISGFDVFEGTYDECQAYLDQHPEDCAFGTLQIYTPEEYNRALRNATDLSDIEYEYRCEHGEC